MSQRDSGYERKERDLYETPEWVTEALLPHIPKFLNIWEPACGSGKMSRALACAGHPVVATDIDRGWDFRNCDKPDQFFRAIITNPPYELASEFISRSLGFTSGVRGIVAMLLRTDFDHARTRQHFFGECPEFAKKVVLTKRIKWFEDSKGSPSFNHAWFIWDHHHRGPPTLAYGPQESAPLTIASHNHGERLPSSDAAGGGADTTLAVSFAHSPSIENKG